MEESEEKTKALNETKKITNIARKNNKISKFFKTSRFSEIKDNLSKMTYKEGPKRKEDCKEIVKLINSVNMRENSQICNANEKL